MLISHLPAGYIDTFLSKNFWSKKLNKKQVSIMLVIGALLGLLPDIDLVYHYLFDAELSHRELITHSPFPYIIGSIIFLIIGILAKNNFLKSFAFLFFLSPCIHLLLDTTTAGIPLFYPFSQKLYGLLMIPAMNEGIYGQFIYVFLYSLEILLILIFINILVFQFIKSKILNRAILLLSIIVFITVVISLTWLNFNLYPKNSLQYYGDIDDDKIINMRDYDIDNDGTINILDNDADSDCISNRIDVENEIVKMEGNWYDFTEDQLFNILSRFGFLSSADLILKSYDSAGIFLGNEMKKDREKDESKYFSDPSDENFNQNFNNLYVYCLNNGYLLNDRNQLSPGDLIFWGNEDDIKHISIISSVTAEKIEILYGNKYTYKIEIINLDQYKDFDNIVGYAKILK